MLIFNEAYSPTSVTATAVPLSLSKASIQDLNFSDYADNIVHIAKYLGFKTYWFSNQGQYGDYSNAITGMAMNCDVKEWLSGGFDHDLLPFYQSALEDKDHERKLIVLHLYGSHVPCEHRYPASESYFKDNLPDDFYDNSIRYTDLLIGKIFDSLKEKKASVLYFSDHGLERITQNNKICYQHGGAKASIDAYKIPMCIWYSPPIKQNHLTGEINNIWSSENNYELIKEWLGVEHELPNESLIDKYQSNNNTITVMNTTGKLKVFSINQK